VQGDDRKLLVLDYLVRGETGSVLVCCSTIKTTEMVHEHPVAQNLEAGLYHGELHPAVRDPTQDAFMDGRYRIVVATKAVSGSGGFRISHDDLVILLSAGGGVKNN
jgi:ATP-dependent DNA helicase RecQ